MAISSGNNFVPKPPPNADMILFATDLVDYVMFHRLNYTLNMDAPPFRKYVYKAFNENTKKAVGLIANGIKENNVATFRKMQNGTAVCVDNYIRLAKSLALRYFDESFDCKLFLFYCVRISGIASLYYNHGISNAPKLAELHITRVLQKYYMIVGLWRNLHRTTAESLNNMQRVNDLISKYTDSEEIDLLFQAPQNQMSVNEENSSIEKQNVLLKDEENKVERQQEYPHAEKEVSLKKSDQFFTESNSEMDLSAFKTPETLEDLSAFKTPETLEDLSAFKTTEKWEVLSESREMSLTKIEPIYNEATQPVYNKPIQLVYNKDIMYAATKNIPMIFSSKIQLIIIAILMALKKEKDLRVNESTGNSQTMGCEVSDLSPLQKRVAFRTYQTLVKNFIVSVKMDINRPFGPSELNVISKHLNMSHFEELHSKHQTLIKNQVLGVERPKTLDLLSYVKNYLNYISTNLF